MVVQKISLTGYIRVFNIIIMHTKNKVKDQKTKQNKQANKQETPHIYWILHSILVQCWQTSRNQRATLIELTAFIPRQNYSET